LLIVFDALHVMFVEQSVVPQRHCVDAIDGWDVNEEDGDVNVDLDVGVGDRSWLVVVDDGEVLDKVGKVVDRGSME